MSTKAARLSAAILLLICGCATGQAKDQNAAAIRLGAGSTNFGIFHAATDHSQKARNAMPAATGRTQRECFAQTVAITPAPRAIQFRHALPAIRASAGA